LTISAKSAKLGRYIKIKIAVLQEGLITPALVFISLYYFAKNGAGQALSMSIFPAGFLPAFFQKGGFPGLFLYAGTVL
jgi:hypothetical protein